jgi:hypothetical protein
MSDKRTAFEALAVLFKRPQKIELSFEGAKTTIYALSISGEDRNKYNEMRGDEPDLSKCTTDAEKKKVIDDWSDKLKHALYFVIKKSFCDENGNLIFSPDDKDEYIDKMFNSLPVAGSESVKNAIIQKAFNVNLPEFALKN